MFLVMAYFLFWMIFIHKQECAVLRYQQNRNAFEYVIEKYMNPLRRLSADLPNHAIEMEIEIHGSVPREVTNDPRRFIRLINPRHHKPIARAHDGAGEEVTAVGTATTATAPDPGQATAAPAVPAAPEAPAAPAAPAVPAASAAPAAPAASTDAESSDPQKIPVFMEDLKKALDELEKKLISNPENLAAAATSGAPVPQASTQPVRSIDDIVQLLKKAIHVEHRMPKAGDEKLEWVQIKIPKSMQM